MNETDWLLNSLGGTLPNSFADIKQSGFDFKLGQNENYWKLDQVKQHPLFKDENGQPSKKKFDDFYNKNLLAFNEYKKEEFDQFQFDQVRVFDTPQNRRLGLSTIAFPLSVKTDKKVYNPFKITEGFIGINEKSEPTKSVMELAQHDEYYDTKEKKFVKNQDPIGGIFDAITLPTLVLAEDENNIPKIHPEKGTFYFETLGDKDPSGKKLLTFDNMLTEERSFLNKNLDFMDSDDLKKSTAGVIAKEALKWAPALIPGIGQYYFAYNAGKSLLEIGLEYGKTIHQALTNSNKDDYPFLNKVEAGLKRFSLKGTSEEASTNPFGFESIVSMISNVGLDLGSQTGVMKIADKVAKAVKGDPSKWGRAGQYLYNVGLANKEMMDIADENNLTPSDRAYLSLATSAAFAALYNFSPFEKLAEKTFNNNTEPKLMQKALKEYVKEINEKLSTIKGLPEAKKPQAYLGMMQEVVNKAAKKTKGLLSKLEQEGATTITEGALSESVEEVSEVYLSEGIKELFNNTYYLFGTTKDKEGKDFKFKNLWGDEFKQEVLLSALGGAIGGAGFKAYDRILNGRKPSKELIQLIQEGKTDLALEQIDKMEEKGLFAPKDLSMETETVNGQTVWKTATKDKLNQNKFIADLLRREIIKNDNYLKTLNSHKLDIDKSKSVIDRAFKNFIDTELHTTLREDALDITDRIIEQSTKINKIKDDIEKADKDFVLADSLKLKLKDEVKVYEDLQKQLKDSLIDENGKFNNLDQYVRQSLFSTLPYLSSVFGLKTKKDFIKDGVLDEEAYKNYIREQRKQDIKTAIKEYETFGSNDNVGKIKSLTDEDFEVFKKNKEVEQLLMEDPSFDLDSIKDFKPDEELVNRYYNPQVEVLKKAVESQFNSINDIAQTYSSLTDNTIDLDSDSTKVDDNFNKLSTALSSLDINKNINEILEENKKLKQELEALDDFEIAAGLGKDYQDQIDKNENVLEELGKLSKVDLKKEFDLLKSLTQKYDDLYQSREQQIYRKLLSLPKSNVSKKIDDIFKDVKDKFSLLREMSKDSANFSSEELIEDIKLFQEYIKKLSAYVTSFKTVNPSMNQFRQTQEAKQFLPSSKLNLIDYEIHDTGYQLLSSRLYEYFKEAVFFLNLAEDNKKNKLKYIIHDQVVQAGRISKTFKDLFGLKTLTPTIDELSAGKILINYKKDSEKLKEVYKELVDLFNEFKKEYKSINKDTIEKLVLEATGLEYSRRESDKLSSDETINLINSILRGDYEDFLTRLKLLLENNETYAPFYYQESALFQLFSKLQNPDYENEFLNQKKTEAENNKTFVAENLSVVDIIAGGGKSQQIIKNLTQLDKDKKFICFTPKKRQGDIIQSVIDENNLENVEIGGLFSDLEKKLFGDTGISFAGKKIRLTLNKNNEVVPDIIYKEDSISIQFEGEATRTELPKPTELDAFKDYSAIIIDEATHLNPILIYWLNKTGIPIIAMCDTSQLGNTVTGFLPQLGIDMKVDWTLETIITERTPKQTYSVRNRYTGVPEATKAMFNMLNSLEAKTDSSDNLFKSIKDREAYQIPVQYTLKDDFIGFFVDKDYSRLDEILDKIKGTDRSNVLFITNDLAKDKPKYEKYGEVFRYDEVQGTEYDYVFILSSENFTGNYKTSAYLKQLYTLVSRGKKATYYNIEGDYNISFKFYKELDKIELTTPLDKETLTEYKNFKIASLSEFTSTKETAKKKESTTSSDKKLIKTVKKSESAALIIKGDGSLGDELDEEDEGDDTNATFVRLFSWYNNKSRSPITSEQDGISPEDQLTILKNAIFFSKGNQSLFDDYLKSFGFNRSFDLSDLKYNIITVPWIENDVLAEGAGKTEGLNFNPTFLTSEPQQMIITASFDGISIDLAALPLIDDKTPFDPETREAGSGTALEYYKKRYRSRIYDVLSSLQEKIVLNGGSLELNKEQVNKLFDLESRGRGGIFTHKKRKLSEFIKEHRAVKFSKPFVITKGDELRGKVAILYTYNKDIPLDKMNEKEISEKFESWYKLKKDSKVQMGLFFLGNEENSLEELVNQYTTIKGTTAEYANRMSSLMSNYGIKQMLILMHELFKYPSPSNKAVASFLSKVDEILKKTISDDESSEYKQRFIDSFKNAKTTTELSNFLNTFFFDKVSRSNKIYDKVRLGAFFNFLKDKEVLDNLPATIKEKKIQAGISKLYGGSSKSDATIKGMLATNSIAFVEPDFLTYARISPIELKVDLDFFESMLDLKPKDDNEDNRNATGGGRKKSGSEGENDNDEDDDREEDDDDGGNEDEEDIDFESLGEGDLFDFTKRKSSLDFTKAINTLQDIQDYRFDGINFLYSFALNRLYKDIVRPSVFIDFEKGRFIESREVNDGILNKKFEILINLLEELEDIKINYEGKSYTKNEFIEDEKISIKTKISIVLENEDFNNHFRKIKPSELFKSYLLNRKENESDKELAGTENKILVPYIDYVILKEFDNFIKYDIDLSDLLVKEENNYVRRTENFFDKKYDQDVAFEDAGTRLFINTINNIPLVEKVNGEYKQRGYLHYAKVLSLMDEIKSDIRWDIDNIHESLKSIILDKARNETNVKLKNIYTSLYLFLYSDADVTYKDEYGKTRTYKSLDTVIRNSPFTEARLFHTAIENSFANTNENYLMSIEESEQGFTVLDPVFVKKDKQKNLLLLRIDNFINRFARLDEDISVDNNKLNEILGFSFFDSRGALNKYGKTWINLFGNTSKSLAENISILRESIERKVQRIDTLLEVQKMLFKKEFDKIEDFLAESPADSQFKSRLFNQAKKIQQSSDKKASRSINLGALTDLLNDVEEISKVLNAVEDFDVKSVLLGKEGTNKARFSHTDNTKNVLERINKNPTIHEGDIIDKFKKC